VLYLSNRLPGRHSGRSAYRAPISSIAHMPKLFSSCLLRHFAIEGGASSAPSLHPRYWASTVLWADPTPYESSGYLVFQHLFPYRRRGIHRVSSVPPRPLSVHLANFSDPGGRCPDSPYRLDICCLRLAPQYRLPHLVHFVAQSVQRVLSARCARAHTLSPNVTASGPMGRYRRLVRPYRTGFPC